MKKHDVTVTVRMPAELADWYGKQAEELGVTKSEIIRMILVQHRQVEPLKNDIVMQALEMGFKFMDKHPELVTDFIKEEEASK